MSFDEETKNKSKKNVDISCEKWYYTSCPQEKRTKDINNRIEKFNKISKQTLNGV